MMTELSDLLECSHRRKDNNVTPLIIQAAILKAQYGIPIEKTVECCKLYYNGQQTYAEKYGTNGNIVKGVYV